MNCAGYWIRIFPGACKHHWRLIPCNIAGEFPKMNGQNGKTFPTSMRQINPKVELASGEFERRRQAGVKQPGLSSRRQAVRDHTTQTHQLQGQLHQPQRSVLTTPGQRRLLPGMKTSSQKASFGGGYGINRKTGGASSLPTAVPPYGRVTVHPGNKGHHKNVNYTPKIGKRTA